MSLGIPDPVERRSSDVSPACLDSTLDDVEWRTDPADAYPPGYPPLCQHPECFGDVEGTVDDSGRMPEYDHTDDVDELVRTEGSRNTTRKRHRVAEVAER